MPMKTVFVLVVLDRSATGGIWPEVSLHRRRVPTRLQTSPHASTACKRESRWLQPTSGACTHTYTTTPEYRHRGRREEERQGLLSQRVAGTTHQPHPGVMRSVLRPRPPALDQHRQHERREHQMASIPLSSPFRCSVSRPWRLMAGVDPAADIWVSPSRLPTPTDSYIRSGPTGPCTHYYATLLLLTAPCHARGRPCPPPSGMVG